MNRPVYESELDRLREERVARVVVAHLDVTFGLQEPAVAHRCPKYYHCDWAIGYGDPENLAALLEVKVRETQYPKYMISLQKCSNIVTMASYAQARALLAVYWEDKKIVGLADLLQCTRDAGFGGRSDRGDAQDREPMIFIPVSEFMTIKPGMII